MAETSVELNIQKKRFRIWYLLYLIIFLPMSVEDVWSGYESGYPLFFVVLTGIAFFFANLGILFYVFRLKAPSNFWKSVVALSVFQLIAEGILDETFLEISAWMSLALWSVGLIFFYPALNANLSLAFPNWPKPNLRSKRFWLGVAAVTLFLVFVLSPAVSFAFVRTEASRVIDELNKHGRLNGVYPLSLDEIKLPFSRVLKSLEYRTTDKDNFALVYRLKPYPVIYSYHSSTGTWVGGFSWYLDDKCLRYLFWAYGKGLQDPEDLFLARSITAIFRVYTFGRYGQKSVFTGDWHHMKAMLFKKEGKNGQAAQEFETARTVFIDVVSNDAERMVKFYNSYGLFKFELMKFEESSELYERAISTRQAWPDYATPSLGESYLGLGHNYIQLFRFDEAEDAYKESLEIFDRFPGNEVNKAGAWHGLGEAYRHQERYKLAKKYYLRALELWKRLLPENHLYLAVANRNLGLLYYYSSEDYGIAERYLMESLNMLRTVPEKNRIEITATENFLAMVWTAQEKEDKAIPVFKKVVKEMSEIMGPKNPAIVNPLTNLGSASYRQKDFNAARDYYEQAVAIWEESGMVRESTNYAQILLSLGATYEELEDWHAAQATFEKAMPYAAQVYDEETLKSVAQDIEQAKKESKKIDRRKFTDALL